LRPYPNIPPTIGRAASSGLATLAELDSVYGVEDLYDILEISIINDNNEYLLSKSREKTR
jgi:hypothetical protein